MSRRGGQPNPFDDILEEMVGVMKDVHGDLQETFGKVRPFNSKQLTPEESLFLYDHPAQHPALRGLTDPTTGVPLTNAQAAQELLQQMGPIDYVRWCETNEAYRAKRAAPQPQEDVTDADDPAA